MVVRRHFDLELRPDKVCLGETQVTVRVLDDCREQNSLSQVCLIKVDVQSSELDIPHGAERLLTAPNRPVLFVEVEQVANAAFGHSINDELNSLMGWGYDLYSWRESGLARVQSQANTPAGGHDDVICISPGCHDVLHDQLEWLAGKHKSRIPSAAVLGGT